MKAPRAAGTTASGRQIREPDSQQLPFVFDAGFEIRWENFRIMPTPEKEARVAQLHEEIEGSDSLYLAEFSGLSVEAMNQLRTQIRGAQARLQVAKNRLLKLALRGTEAEPLTEHLTGPTAITFCGDDPVPVAKVFATFAKDHEAVAIKAGFVEGRVLNRQQAERIAALPPRPQILAALLGQLAAPAAGLIRVLGAGASELVFTLEAIADKRQESEDSQ